MIKSVRINPVKLIESDAFAKVSVCVDAAKLSALYVENGIDPETISVPIGDAPVSLKAAADSGLEIDTFVNVYVARRNQG